MNNIWGKSLNGILRYLFFIFNMCFRYVAGLQAFVIFSCLLLAQSSHVLVFDMVVNTCGGFNFIFYILLRLVWDFIGVLHGIVHIQFMVL